MKLPSFLLHCPTFMASAGVSTFHPTRRAVQPSLQWREGRGAKVEKQAADRVQQWSGKAAFRVKDSQYIYKSISYSIIYNHKSTQNPTSTSAIIQLGQRTRGTCRTSIFSGGIRKNWVHWEKISQLLIGSLNHPAILIPSFIGF